MSINVEMLKQLLDEFNEKEALNSAEINVVEQQIIELEGRIEETRGKLLVVAADREKVSAMMSRHIPSANGGDSTTSESLPSLPSAPITTLPSPRASGTRLPAASMPVAPTQTPSSLASQGLAPTPMPAPSPTPTPFAPGQAPVVSTPARASDNFRASSTAQALAALTKPSASAVNAANAAAAQAANASGTFQAQAPAPLPTPQASQPTPTPSGFSPAGFHQTAYEQQSAPLATPGPVPAPSASGTFQAAPASQASASGTFPVSPNLSVPAPASGVFSSQPAAPNPSASGNFPAPTAGAFPPPPALQVDSAHNPFSPASAAPAQAAGSPLFEQSHSAAAQAQEAAPEAPLPADQAPPSEDDDTDKRLNDALRGLFR